MKGNCCHYEVQVVVVNFSPNGPIMRGSGMNASREEAVRETELSVGWKPWRLETWIRAIPENPTAVTMPGFLCVDHSIVECWITTMSSGKRSQRLVSLAWLNPPRKCIKLRCYMEIIIVQCFYRDRKNETPSDNLIKHCFAFYLKDRRYSLKTVLFIQLAWRKKILKIA